MKAIDKFFLVTLNGGINLKMNMGITLNTVSKMKNANLRGKMVKI
tara:strand:- start:525 stop:659 length:135 start_codon:yes stop_codon:yes gene_type:complete